ncbi:MAG TPA: transcription antitermination factor NusB [Candidatus Acidoferrales bacterium]|nr:transcription antitermination factor NusB [Candidatus Acidoferrales bacterium]
MGTRRKGRELALQVLYEANIKGDMSPAALEFGLSHAVGSTKAKEFARRLVFGVVGHLEEINRVIEKSSEHWRLDRMAKVDLIILQVATYELLFCPDIPVQVTIDEALEVGKRYGAEDSPPFINGILDHVAQSAGLKERAQLR